MILDVVYGHTGANFPYEYVYSRLGYRENPFMGSFAKRCSGRAQIGPAICSRLLLYGQPFLAGQVPR